MVRSWSGHSQVMVRSWSFYFFRNCFCRSVQCDTSHLFYMVSSCWCICINLCLLICFGIFCICICSFAVQRSVTRPTGFTWFHPAGGETMWTSQTSLFSTPNGHSSAQSDPREIQLARSAKYTFRIREIQANNLSRPASGWATVLGWPAAGYSLPLHPPCFPPSQPLLILARPGDQVPHRCHAGGRCFLHVVTTADRRIWLGFSTPTFLHIAISQVTTDLVSSRRQVLST